MINLLPVQYKTEILQEENWKLTLILGILFLIFLILFTLILFTIKISISSQVEAQKTLVDLEEKEFLRIQPLQEKINSVNQDLSKLDSFYQAQFSLTEFLERISEIIPEGIYLTSFSYQRDTSQVTFSGYAPTVGILVDFKNNLEKQEDFKEVRFPPATWIESADIDFNVTFKIRK